MPNAFENAYKLFAKGELVLARSSLEAHLRGQPGDAPACFLLGVIDMEEGMLEGGLKRLEESLSGFQPPAQLCHRAGRILFDKKNYRQAAHWLGQALARDPGLSASHYWLGNTHRLLGDYRASEQALKKAIELSPDQARAYVSLAYLYREEGHLDDAAETMMALMRVAKGQAETFKKIAEFMVDIHRLDLAERVLSRILPEENENPEFLTRLGQIRQKLGMFDEAAQVYRRAIIRNPSSDAAYLGLSVVKKYDSPDDPDAVILRQALDNEGVEKEAIICSHFALGKVMDDCRDFEQAFEHYEAANTLKSESISFDRAAFRGLVQGVKSTFAKDFFASSPKDKVPGPAPIFIVGMLRSGTTLVESIVAGHAKVFGAGELSHIDMLAEGLGRETGISGTYPGYVPMLDNKALRSAARYYLQEVAARSAGEPYLIDKNPLNFMHLGLIAALFPNAKVIHCQRHALDTAVSIYFQHFAHEANAYAYDLGDIAAVTLEYRRLMDHWYHDLPLDIFDLDYQALVKFPEKVTQRLMNYLGLEWDEACLEFHDKERAVETASLWQVRQPLYRSSIDRWKNYEKHLGPLIQKFEKAGVL
jgi:tetratricopeptide (TPR) repeat protein